jgi:hypothetical protein
MHLQSALGLHHVRSWVCSTHVLAARRQTYRTLTTSNVVIVQSGQQQFLFNTGRHRRRSSLSRCIPLATVWKPPHPL